MRSSSIADQVAELEESYVTLLEEHNQLKTAHETVLNDLEEVTQEIRDLSSELDWYRSTFPEGSDAYACMRRME